MAKEEKKPSAPKEIPGFYKGYDINWLKKEGEGHPDHYLVEEYESKKEE